MLPARTASISIDAAPDAVYRFLADAMNMARWAPGFCQTIIADPAVERGWRITTAEGAPARARFVAPNAMGVVDHWVTLADGTEVYVPLRVVPNGAGSEVLLTVFQQPSMSDALWEKDVAAVCADLERLKAALEPRQPPV
jgi:hypothetical protein